MDYSNLCQTIMDLNPGIRYVGICDDSGETVYGGQRDGVKDLLTKEETREANIQTWAIWSVRGPFTSKVGRAKYTVTEFEKIKRISMPLDDNYLLVVTAEVNTNHDDFIKKILNLTQS